MNKNAVLLALLAISSFATVGLMTPTVKAGHTSTVTCAVTVENDANGKPSVYTYKYTVTCVTGWGDWDAIERVTIGRTNGAPLGAPGGLPDGWQLERDVNVEFSFQAIVPFLGPWNLINPGKSKTFTIISSCPPKEFDWVTKDGGGGTCTGKVLAPDDGIPMQDTICSGTYIPENSTYMYMVSYVKGEIYTVFLYLAPEVSIEKVEVADPSWKWYISSDPDLTTLELYTYTNPVNASNPEISFSLSSSNSLPGNIVIASCGGVEYLIGPISPARDWLMFGHDLSHTRYSHTIAPNTNETLWSYTAGSWVDSSPAVAYGKVYVGSGDSKVYCLNASTGAFIWNYTTGGDVKSSPIVVDGKVYVGSYDSKVYCLNASTGAFIWNYTTGNLVRSSPAVAYGKVYVGSFDFKVYCLNASTGAFIWNYTTGNLVRSSPAVAYGKVYVGSYDSKVYCLNASTGAFIWNYTAGSWVASSPAVIDGKVYVGSGDDKVYCLNASTGALVWSYTTGGDVDSSPAVAYGKVYIGSLDFKVYCLDASTGAFIWSHTIGNWVLSSPAVAHGKVYVGSIGNKVYCLDASTGAFIWSYKTGSFVESSPAVANGKVYVGAHDDKVYAFADHDIAIYDVAPSKIVVGSGYSLSIETYVVNQGYYPETFNVLAYANTTLIASQAVTLSSGNSKTITLTWNTTGFAKGNYTIKAVADTLPGETDTTDNTLTDGWIFVSIPGDINSDKTVNILDCIRLANHFGHVNGNGHTPYTKEWKDCMNCDINSDGRVNILDCIILAGHFGQKWQ